ncbi:ATP-dependent helicase [Mycoplasma sp. Mirounga ES2805-ORL]|uniref:ATP-dependent helicase n=1 Tax=Mycoplasma sp. Mirounga ES2805-ORL TaxID=754514 RepID=UPI00197B3489|nr:UvrD-helicase domain-containing protein [Mycoplasma sp. Mirounga ES2805-ORL]QSF13874.1 UvrD-helicase domain-containing protein [Mycoplasma sp. Mirounga ES2805-ORL]
MKRIDQILDKLNDKQLEALKYFDGPLRIIAGAGSGKTRVLTRKIAYLVSELGISPSKILATTFTNKAANEMTERVKQYTGEEINKLQICTFHSLCANILRKEAFHLNLNNDFQILDESDKKQVITSIYKNNGYDVEEVNFKYIIRVFSRAKNNDFTTEELIEELNKREPASLKSNAFIGKLFDEYNQYLKDKKCLDFDDLIILTKKLFTDFPEIRKIWSSKFSYILVDEFQDTSKHQYEIVKFLASDNAQLTIVGDPDQTIYGWRGADVNLILNFDKDFKNTKTIILDTNYRSTPTILNAANQLIKHNKKRFNKDLKTINPDGEPIEYTHAFSVEAEARWVVQKINELKKKKIQLKNIAIFYRSNHYSRSFEQELINEGINHKIFNGLKFFQRKEVKDVLAFLRVIYDGSDIALTRIINVPNRGIGEVSLKKITDAANQKKMSIYKYLIENFMSLDIKKKAKENLVLLLNLINKYRRALKQNGISSVLTHFLKEINYLEYIDSDLTLNNSGRENIDELLESIKEWEKQNQGKGLREYLEEISIFSAGDEFDNSINYVSLMTVHAAKGLEFDNVFLVGMNENVFPHIKTLETSDEEMLEEERRLAYVAVTRAKDRLFVSSSRGYLFNTNTQKQPSRFLSEMGIDLNKTILHHDPIDLSIIQATDEKEIKSINKQIIRGDIIAHTFFGEGTVVEVSNETIIVKFTNNRIETLEKNHPSIRLLRSESEN